MGLLLFFFWSYLLIFHIMIKSLAGPIMFHDQHSDDQSAGDECRGSQVEWAE